MSRAGSLEQALEVCLAAQRAGQDLEVVLQRYPDLRDELEPLLHLTLRLGQLTEGSPSPGFRAAARGRLMAAARSSDGAPTGIGPFRGSSASIARRLAASLATLFALGLAGSVTLTASASALPGEALYPLKRLGEDVQLKLAPSDAERMRLQLRLLDERLAETLTLADRGESARVDEALASYTRTLEQIDQERGEVLESTAPGQFSELMETHQERLAEVLERAPQQAQPGLQRALDRSRRGLEQAATVHETRTAVETAPGASTPTDATRGNAPASAEPRDGNPEERDVPGGRSDDRAGADGKQRRDEQSEKPSGRERAEEKAGPKAQSTYSPGAQSTDTPGASADDAGQQDRREEAKPQGLPGPSQSSSGESSDRGESRPSDAGASVSRGRDNQAAARPRSSEFPGSATLRPPPPSPTEARPQAQESRGDEKAERQDEASRQGRSPEQRPKDAAAPGKPGR